MSDKPGSEPPAPERDERGRFQNFAGPGRPARAVELTYLRALSDELTLDDWREIVRQAVTLAKEGDAQARAWVSRYALGAAPPALTDLAVRDVLAIDDELEARALAKDASTPAVLKWAKTTPIESALDVRQAEQEQAEQERQADERRRRRAERKARQAPAAADLGESGQGDEPAAQGEGTSEGV